MKLLVVLICLLSLSVGAQPVAQLPTGPVEDPTISFSRDSSRILLFAGDDYWVWDVLSQQKVVSGHLDDLVDASLSPDGRRLAVGTRPPRLEVVTMESGKREFLHIGPSAKEGQDSGGYASSFSPNGRFLMVWGAPSHEREANEPWAYQFAWPSGKLLRKYPISSGGGRCYWSSDGKLMLDTDYHTIEVRVPETGDLLESVQAYEREAREPVERRFGILEQTEEEGRVEFARAPLGYKAQHLWEGGGIAFYARGSDKPLGPLEFGLCPTLSPDGLTLAVLTREGVLLIDVKATLANAAAGNDGLIGRLPGP